MKVRTHHDVDVLGLFVHDKWDVGALSAWHVARALERTIREAVDDAHEVEWEVKSPDDTGLSRFTLWKDGELVPNVRIRSVGEVESGFPAHVLGALRALEGREFVLEGTALEETARKKAKK